MCQNHNLKVLLNAKKKNLHFFDKLLHTKNINPN